MSGSAVLGPAAGRRSAAVDGPAAGWSADWWSGTAEVCSAARAAGSVKQRSTLALQCDAQGWLI